MTYTVNNSVGQVYALDRIPRVLACNFTHKIFNTICHTIFKLIIYELLGKCANICIVTIYIPHPHIIITKSQQEAVATANVNTIIRQDHKLRWLKKEKLFNSRNMFQERKQYTLIVK